MGCCRSKKNYVQDIYPDENVGIDREPNNVPASGNINNLQTDTAVTLTVGSPALTKLALPSTPSTQSRKALPFWCPICFNYFKDIYKMSCCSNYICEDCSKAFIKKKMGLSTIKEVPSEALDISCPLCATQGVTFAFETGDCANPRNYQESPHTRKAMLAADARRSNKENSQNVSHNSLERVGEYEDDREASTTRRSQSDRPTLTVLPGSVKAPTSPIPEAPEPTEDVKLAPLATKDAPVLEGSIEEEPEEPTPNPAAAVA